MREREGEIEIERERERDWRTTSEVLPNG